MAGSLRIVGAATALAAACLLAFAEPQWARAGGTTTTLTVTDTLTFDPVQRTNNVYLDGTADVYQQTVVNGSALFPGAPVPEGQLGETTRGAPGIVVYGSPVFVGSTLTLVSSVTGATVYSQESASDPIIATTTIIGPADLTTGDVSVCGAAYAALPSTTKPVCGSNPHTFSFDGGVINIDTTVSTAYVVLATTTTTDTYSGANLYRTTGTVTPIGTIHPAAQGAAFGAESSFLRSLGDEALPGAGVGGAPGRIPSGSDAALTTSSIAESPAYRGWAEAYGLYARQDEQDGLSGTETRTGGMRGGFVLSYASGFTLGFGVDQGWTGISETDGYGSADIRLTQFGLDASYASGNWVLDAAALGGIGKATTVDYGGSSASYDLTAWGVEGEAGYRLHAGDSWTWTPKLGFDWTSVHNDAFTSSGSFGLAGDAHTAARTRGWLGLEAAKTVALDSGRTLDFKADARLIGVMSGRERTLPVEFGGAPLQVVGLTEGEVAGDFAVAAALHVSQNATLLLAGEAQVVDHASYGVEGRLGLAVTF